MIPVANPGAGYRALQAEIDAAVGRALRSGWYILGNEGRAFEGEFAAWLGASRAIGVGNGTDALVIALRALGIGSGDRVATVSHTAVATVAAIEMAGATPVLLDIDAATFTLDPADLDALLGAPDGARIRAVIVVHLYGQAVDLAAVAGICARHGVALIEDCSQAHGATIEWEGAARKLGTVGAVGTFSCYPTKNLGALGDGGLIATGDAALADRMAALRQYGWRSHYISDEAGVNSRLDEVQAAILRVKLTHLDKQNARRRAVAAAYDDALAGGPLVRPARRPGAGHVFHLYVVRATTDRAAIQTRLRDAGVATGIHYPVPVHLQPAYRDRVALGPAGCRRTEQASAEILSLPMWPEMTDDDVEAVCRAVRAL